MLSLMLRNINAVHDNVLVEEVGAYCFYCALSNYRDQ